VNNHETQAKRVATLDPAFAAFIIDLKKRGLFEHTIVLCGGEFGRSPKLNGVSGRDHWPTGFSMVLAGGGFRRGYVHGATDEIGYRAVENTVSVPEMHATAFQLLGLDHKKVTFQHHGREESLTDFPVTHAEVVAKLTA